MDRIKMMVIWLSLASTLLSQDATVNGTVGPGGCDGTFEYGWCSFLGSPVCYGAGDLASECREVFSEFCPGENLDNWDFLPHCYDNDTSTFFEFCDYETWDDEYNGWVLTSYYVGCTAAYLGDSTSHH